MSGAEEGDERARVGRVLVRALLVGVAVGLVGAAFRAAIGLVENLHAQVRALALPAPLTAFALGAAMVGTAVFLVRRFAPEAGGSGVQEIEGALDGLRPVRWRRVLPVKFAGGALALGSGLALGREGPTIQMGGALGRMIADLLRLGDEAAHPLVAAGAGAGLAAAFNAPLSGVLFVIEEMRGQFHYGVLAVQSVLIACVVADAVVRLLLGSAPTLPMPAYAMPVDAFWLFLVFGGLIGAFGRAFNMLLISALDLFDSIPARLRIAAACAVGGAGAWVLLVRPDVMGGGYSTIDLALRGGIAQASLLGLVAMRLGTTVASYASGAPGGIFAPMVALGALLGLWFGHVAGDWFPGLQASPGVFAVAGMAALFSATVRAPLTGIALAAELTGEFALILPIAVSTIGASLTVHALGGRPIYSVLLERTLARAGTPVRAPAAPRSAPRSGA